MPAIAHITLEQRIRAIASAAPFKTWPEPTLTRLARSAQTLHYRSGATIFTGGNFLEGLAIVVDGSVQSSVTAPDGRRVTFRLVKGGVYGLHPMLDGREMLQDVVAAEPANVLLIPHAAIHAELANSPALWQSVALEVNSRARRYGEQMKQFLFDSPRQRMAAVLLGLAQGSAHAGDGPAPLPVRLPQERLAEMLGVSRQWATTLVREMSQAGLIEWRYGRVTVLDQAGLHAIAEEGINPKNNPRRGD